ncbi:MAG: hypothetical protein GQ548_03225 [Methylophaga sp.]|nr:hypothetical protein [Methylophaga sp.]
MRLIFIILALLTLSSCTTRIYGVPEDQWATLSPTEREQAIEHHQEMELLREQRRIEEAKVAAEQEKKQRLEMEYRQARADQIYSGERGIRGDLLRVTIRGGELYIKGKHRHYSPVSFKIADGEQKTITFYHPKKSHYQTDVAIEYYDGVLTFDYDQSRNYKYRYELVYEPEWRHGKHYRNITFNKHSHSRAKNIEIIVDAISLPHR